MTHRFLSAPTPASLPASVFRADVPALGELLLLGDARPGGVARGVLRLRHGILAPQHGRYAAFAVGTKTLGLETDDPDEDAPYHLPATVAEIYARGCMAEIEHIVNMHVTQIEALRTGCPPGTSVTSTEMGLCLYHESRRPPSGLKGVQYQYVTYDLMNNAIGVHWRENGYHTETLVRHQDADAWDHWYRKRDASMRIPTLESAADRTRNDRYLENKVRIVREVLESRDRAGSYFGERVADFLAFSAYCQQMTMYETQLTYEDLFGHLQRELLSTTSGIVTDFDLQTRAIFTQERERTEDRKRSQTQAEP